ncbi:MAG: hypothetical protein U0703_13885 [Anaerolineae bacterium]
MRVCVPSLNSGASWRACRRRSIWSNRCRRSRPSRFPAEPQHGAPPVGLDERRLQLCQRGGSGFLLIAGVILFRQPGNAPLPAAVSNVAALPTGTATLATKLGDEEADNLTMH